MKKLCIILGAGASKDIVGSTSASPSLISHQWQPPLSSELFISRATFDGVLKHHPKAHGIVAQLKNKISNASTSLEKELTLLSRSNNPEDIRSVKFITYYLWDLFKNISLNYLNQSPSNYDILVRLILSRDIEVMFLTLNYDLFIEESLRKSGNNITFDDINKYIPQDRKWLLVKPHGSINWARGLINPADAGPNLNSPDIEKLDLNSGLHKKITIVHLTGNYDFHMPDTGRGISYPAIAIPTEIKYDFVCPPEHIEKAKEFLGQCSNFLVIGCSLKDENIKDLLGSNIKSAGRLMIANGGPQAGNATLLELQKMPAFNHNKYWPGSAYSGGFNEFISSGELEKFLDLI